MNRKDLVLNFIWALIRSSIKSYTVYQQLLQMHGLGNTRWVMPQKYKVQENIKSVLLPGYDLWLTFVSWTLYHQTVVLNLISL